MLKQAELFKNGFHVAEFRIDDEIRVQVQEKDWSGLDQSLKSLLSKGGRLYQFLLQFHEFDTIEFIISLRDADNSWEEDGIWHDDGSRVFSFSLSLTEKSPQGGALGVRQKGQESFIEIPTPALGGIILFLTGAYGFEHKIHQVTHGQRLVIAGWCT